MVSTSKMEKEKFNGKNIELWKLKMEDLLMERDQWIVVLRKKPTGMKDEDWKNLDRKAKNLIILCLLDLVLLNVFGEATAIYLWDKLGSLY